MKPRLLNNLAFVNTGIRVTNVQNDIVHGLTIQKVLAPTDVIAVQKLLDITHAGDFITVPWSYLRDYWKASLVGHSDSNSAKDTSHLLPLAQFEQSYCFRTGHIFNNYYSSLGDKIETRDGARHRLKATSSRTQARRFTPLVQVTLLLPVNDLGVGTNTALVGTISSSKTLYSTVPASTGATVWFSSSKS